MDYPKHDYKEYPKTLDPDDLWGQVRRTVMGKPVSEEQIGQIVAAIGQGLALKPEDHLLDLACGNGALSRYFFDQCAGFVGADFSEYLISVAQRLFANPPAIEFFCNDVASFVQQIAQPERFTKVLCYGSFAYFPPQDAHTMLSVLRQRFANVERVFIGNLPDRDKAAAFYPAGRDYSAEINQHESQIGLWRSREQMTALAHETGWDIQFSTMPEGFFAAHYRYDALLVPRQ